MIAPAAMFIEMAVDRMVKDQDYMHQHKVILDKQLTELAFALPGQPESFSAGYALGLETARIVIGGLINGQVIRLMNERDLLLSAIAHEDYVKIEAQFVKISETPDNEVNL